MKHARATHVVLRLRCDDEQVTFEINDDGRGFDPQATYAGHLGLRSMRERALQLGGRVEIESAPGQGTRIVATLPLRVRAGA